MENSFENWQKRGWSERNDFSLMKGRKTYVYIMNNKEGKCCIFYFNVTLFSVYNFLADILFLF